MINTTQSKAINAYVVFESIYQKKLKFQTALKLFKLREELKKQYDFQLEQEKSILERCNGNINDDGNVIFDNEEHRDEAQKALSELSETQIEIENAPIDLSSEDIEISAEEIGKIESFLVL